MMHKGKTHIKRNCFLYWYFFSSYLQVGVTCADGRGRAVSGGSGARLGPPGPEGEGREAGAREVGWKEAQPREGKVFSFFFFWFPFLSLFLFYFCVILFLFLLTKIL